jgi:hypothetical protein
VDEWRLDPWLRGFGHQRAHLEVGDWAGKGGSLFSMGSKGTNDEKDDQLTPSLVEEDIESSFFLVNGSVVSPEFLSPRLSA